MENVQLPQEILQAYKDYLSDIKHLEAERKPTDGLMGFGQRPGYDPCHERFSERLEQTLDTIAVGSPSSGTAFAVLCFIYDTPVEFKDNTLVYWMLLAVHRHTEKLIRFLLPEDAAALTVRYSDKYPKYSRLPVQKKISALLQEQAGACAIQKRKGLRNYLKGRSSN